MRKLLLALVVLPLAAPVRAAPAAPPKDGPAALYRGKCAYCHGEDGHPTPVGLRRGTPAIASTRLTEKAIAAEIANGKNKMPAFKTLLSAKQIRALARYVKKDLR